MITGTPTILRASVATPAELSGVPDDQYQDGDFGYTSSSKQTYRLDRASSAVPNGTTTVATFTGNGRWIAYPGFAVIDNDEDHLIEDTTVAGALPVRLLGVTVTTEKANEKVLVLFTFAGRNDGDGSSTLIAQINVDGTPETPCGGTGTGSTNQQLQSGAIVRTLIIPTAGAHIIEIFAGALGDPFLLAVASTPERSNGAMSVLRLGA